MNFGTSVRTVQSKSYWPWYYDNQSLKRYLLMNYINYVCMHNLHKTYWSISKHPQSWCLSTTEKLFHYSQFLTFPKDLFLDDRRRILEKTSGDNPGMSCLRYTEVLIMLSSAETLLGAVSLSIQWKNEDYPLPFTIQCRCWALGS